MSNPTIDPTFRHLIAVSFDHGDGPDNITDLVDFVIANIDDPELSEMLDMLKSGNIAKTGGGASPTVYIHPIFQPHVVE